MASSSSSSSSAAVTATSDGAADVASPTPANKLKETFEWVIRMGLREYVSELVPVLVQAKIASLDRIIHDDVLPLKEKLSKKAFMALSKKCASSSGTDQTAKKKKKLVDPTTLPSIVDLSPGDDTTVAFINRAPVLQLWTTCISKVLGFSDVLSLCIASVFVRDMSERKKKMLGLSVDKPQAVEEESNVGKQTFNVLGFDLILPVDEDDLNVMASKSLRYMENAFGDDFIKFYSAMMARANVLGKEALDGYGGYEEYERFRPPTSAGTKGFGEKGRFHLRSIKG